MAQLNRTISYKGIQLSINYTYYPASRGAREHGTGLQLEPDEPESVDIDNVELESELGDLTRSGHTNQPQHLAVCWTGKRMKLKQNYLRN